MIILFEFHPNTGNFDLARFLIEHDADVDAEVQNHDLTPLMCAAKKGNYVNCEFWITIK